jgi:predicted nucleic acid-binding protein
VLVDTSTLLRTLQRRHPQYSAATRAIEILPRRGHQLHIVPQNLVEFWVVATRPVDQNGLGLHPTEAANEVARLKEMFLLLPESQAIYPAWERLVTAYGVSGKPAHDARIVAAMQVHGLTAILTFDRSGFARYRDVEIHDPVDVAATA